MTDEFSRRLWDLTEKQEGAISHKQLLDNDLTWEAIHHRVDKGRLWPKYRGSYAVGRPQLATRGVWRAALLAVGEDAVLSHLSAAAYWLLLDEKLGLPPHVSIPTQTDRGEWEGIVLHRSDTLEANDIIEKQGLRVTSLARTHLDLTIVVGIEKHRAALRESEYRYRFDLGAFRRAVEEPRRSIKHGRMRRLLDEWVPGIGLTESQLEARFYEVCDRAKLLLPQPQVWLLGKRVDFLWRDLHLVIEVDGYEAHRGRIAFQEDRARDRKLKAAGYEVLRFTWAEVVGQPKRVAAELAAAHMRLSR